MNETHLYMMKIELEQYSSKTHWFRLDTNWGIGITKKSSKKELFNLKANVGKTDRIIRIILGLALLSLFFILDGGMRYIGLVGIVLLLTAFIKFCPLYAIFRVNTCSKK